MRIRSALLALLAFALTGVFVPVLAAPLECAEDDCGDCCAFDCALCLCCLHVPPSALTDAAAGMGGSGSSNLSVDGGLVPLVPLPRDILHVPRSAVSR